MIFTRVSAHRTATFTIVILGLATVDSIMIATLPMAGGALPRPVFPIAGLVVPVRQLAPLLGLAQFSSRYLPRDDLVADTVVHSVTAGAVAWLAPPWIGWKSTPA